MAAGLALALTGATAAQNPSIFKKAPPEVEEKLRARVTQFYSLYVEGKFRQAEALIAEESKDIFYAMQKAPVRSFQLEQITFDDGFQMATVMVACLSAAPRTAAQGIWVPVNGQWKLENGDWRLLLKGRTTTPFGPMKFEDPRSVKPQPFTRPTLEMLKANALQVEPKKVVFPKDLDGGASRLVTIQNNMAGVVHVEVHDPKVPGLALGLGDKNILPNQFTRLEMIYSPPAEKITGTREVRLTLQPLNQEVVIQVEFQ